jgi:hypothetical protein
MSGECQCSFRIRMLGDGCQYCNPKLHAELLAEQEADEPIPYRITPAGREHLDGKA